MKKPTMKQLQEYAVKNAFNTRMNSGGIDSYSNYIGKDLVDAVMVISQSRDSDTLELSNFATAFEMLGGEEIADLEIHRMGHWACGWVETITVNPKNIELLTKAWEIKQALENYPVLDDMDYSNREHEAHAEYAEQEKEDLVKALVMHFGVKASKKLTNIAFALNMECQAYFGDDSCVNVYTCRKPDLGDINRLKECLKQIGHHEFKASRVLKKLIVAVDAYAVSQVA